MSILEGRAPTGCTPGWRLFLAVFLLASALNLLWLGRAPLADPTEARHAEIGREMAESGRWLVSTLNYRPHLTKPPLTNWLVAAGIRIFGANEFGARFFNALLAALGVGLVAAFGCRLAGRSAGLAAAAFYFVSPFYLALSRTVSIDVLLTVPILAGYWAAWEASREDCAHPRWAALAFGLALGLGALAKGHIVLLVVLAPVVAWIAAGRRWRLARRLAWPPAIALFLAVALPWYVYIQTVFPQWLSWIITKEFVRRIVGAHLGDANFGLSILSFLGGALPFVALALLPFLRRGRDAEGPGAAGRDARSLLALWALLPLAVFSVVSCQRANYVFPLMPPAAVLAGMGWTRLCARWPQAGRGRRAAAFLAVGVVGLGGPACLVALMVMPEIEPGKFPLLASLASALTLTGALSIIALRRGSLRAGAGLLLAAGLLLWGLSLPISDVGKSRRSSRATCTWVKRNLDAGDRPLVYRSYLASVSFYIGGHVRMCMGKVPGSDWGGRWPAPEVAADVQELSTIRNLAGRRGGVWLVLKRANREALETFGRKGRLLVDLRQLDAGVLLAHLRERPGPLPGAEGVPHPAPHPVRGHRQRKPENGFRGVLDTPDAGR